VPAPTPDALPITVELFYPNVVPPRAVLFWPKDVPPRAGPLFTVVGAPKTEPALEAIP